MIITPINGTVTIDDVLVPKEFSVEHEGQTITFTRPVPLEITGDYETEVITEGMKRAYNEGLIQIRGTRSHLPRTTIRLPAQYSVPSPNNPFTDMLTMLTVKNVNRYDDGEFFVIELALLPHEYVLFPLQLKQLIESLGGTVEGYNP